jgi:hypothetical protein
VCSAAAVAVTSLDHPSRAALPIEHEKHDPLAFRRGVSRQRADARQGVGRRCRLQELSKGGMVRDPEVDACRGRRQPEAEPETEGGLGRARPDGLRRIEAQGLAREPRVHRKQQEGPAAPVKHVEGDEGPAVTRSLRRKQG